MVALQNRIVKLVLDPTWKELWPKPGPYSEGSTSIRKTTFRETTFRQMTISSNDLFRQKLQFYSIYLP
jgi:hypothetical protein